MKTVYLLIAPVLVFSACEPSLPEVTPEEGERVAQIAAPAAAELLRTLVGRLTAALDEGGPSRAFELCSDGDAIDAFIVTIDPATADGLVFATLNNGGLIRCEASGAMNVGELVEAGAVAAAGTAETNGLPLISTKAAVAADIADDASGAEIATAVNTILAEALLQNSAWQVVSANTSDGVVTTGDLTVVIKRV